MRCITWVLTPFLVVVMVAAADSGGEAWPASVVGQLVGRYLSSCRLALVAAGGALADPSFTELVRCCTGGAGLMLGVY